MGGEDDVAAARQSHVVVLGWYYRWVLPAADYHGVLLAVLAVGVL